MSKNEDRLFDEIKLLREELREVRQVDLPSLHTSLVAFKTEVDTTARLTMRLGGGIAAVFSAALTWLAHHVIRAAN